ncbi:MAG: hypothetical protein Q8O56_06465 [Solirubrobacteraceae bacterium]|nr:hypothetical protein [Solirubrobacteraceae bacterium]
MGTHDDLLRRFQPALRYDSNEQFFADGAAQYTDAAGLQLRRAALESGASGAVLASAGGADGHRELSLAFLGPKHYGSGEEVDKTDVLGVQGRDYRAQYVRLRTSRPDLNNRIYGRAVEANGRLWLQYWTWYFYNDYQLALGFGTHEGDWESVQFRIGIDGDVPDVAVYAQHRHGEKRDWESVEKLPDSPDTPVVYVARGSHAAYFEAGYHQTEAWYDLADGKRPAPKLELEIVEHATHAWMRWPGRWGDTLPQKGKQLDLDQASPTGPGTKRHWRDPNALLDGAKPSKVSDPPPAPDVRITRGAGDVLELAYDFSGREQQPSALVVTVNSRNEKGVPPITHTFDELDVSGTFQTTIPLDPEHHFDVYTSTVTGDPPLPSASRFTEVQAVKPEKDQAFGPEVAKKIGRFFAKIRGDLRSR